MTQIIFLTQGYYTTLDDEDFDKLRSHLWHAAVQPEAHNQLVYANSRINGRHQNMHTVILPYVKGKEVNHKDHDGLNNRRMNLEYVTHGANIRHGRFRSGSNDYRNIYPTPNGRWQVIVKVQQRLHYIGRYDTIDEALAARNASLLQRGLPIPMERKEGFVLDSTQELVQ